METFFLQSRKENPLSLERKKYECNHSKPITFLNPAINRQTIIYSKNIPVIAWDITLKNTNIIILRIQPEFLMSDTTSCQEVHYKRNGMSIVIEFSDKSDLTETIYQEVKSILSGELQEQLQKIL